MKLYRLFFVAITATMVACQSQPAEQTASESKDSVVEPLKTIAVGRLSQVAAEQKKAVAQLEHAQSVTTNVDSMFLYDSVIAAAKIKSIALVSKEFSALSGPVTVPFTQTANTDKISITDVKLVSVKDLNELVIEAQVKALASSAFATPFAGLTAVNAQGKKLDIGGGIGFTKKLVAGQSYTVKGTIYNYQLLDSAVTVQFDEDIKKW